MVRKRCESATTRFSKHNHVYLFQGGWDDCIRVVKCAERAIEEALELEQLEKQERSKNRKKRTIIAPCHHRGQTEQRSRREARETHMLLNF